MIGQISTTEPPKRDIYQRARLFVQESFTHHAKTNLNLVQAIIDCYSAPGDLVIDPMAGSGSIYVAALTGRRVLAGDIEPQWARLLRDNEKAVSCRSLFAFSTPGLACQWDAAKLPLSSGHVDLCVSSPPYFDTFGSWDAESRLVPDDRQNEHGISYGAHTRQIANIHIYEEYLRAMLAVYLEVWRVLRPGGKLILIVKDVIRGGRTVPVVADNLGVALAAGFRLEKRFYVPARDTYFRNVQRVKIEQEAPATESVLALQRTGHRAKKRLALVELPAPHDGPGWIIAQKAIAHAGASRFGIWVRSPSESEFRWLPSVASDENEFRHLVGETSLDDGAPARNALSPGDHGQSGFGPGTMKARERRARAFAMMRQLQEKTGLAAGDEIAFYGSERFGKYVCQRLETLGCDVSKPLAGAMFLRVDVPDVDGQPGFTKFYGASAVYAITPCSEEVTRLAVGRLAAKPISIWIPELHHQLPPPTVDADDDFDYEKEFL